MRCMPSSRSLSENRGVSLTVRAIALVDIGPGTFSASRIPSANTQRSPESANRGLALNVARCTRRWWSSRCVMASSAATCTMRLPSSPSRRLPGETARLAVLGKPKSSLKPRATTARMCAWQLMRPGKSALPRPS